MKETLQDIRTRRSCRKFQDRQISRVELDAVLEAGTYAPSAGGRQSAFIVAVQNKEQRKKLAAMNAAVIGSKSNPFYDAPTYWFLLPQMLILLSRMELVCLKI